MKIEHSKNPIFKDKNKGIVGFGGAYGGFFGNQVNFLTRSTLISITSRDISITSIDNLISLEDNFGLL